MDPKGRLIYTYQKAFLYETDENWAAEGPGFVSTHIDGLGKVNIAHNPFVCISSVNALIIGRVWHLHGHQPIQI